MKAILLFGFDFVADAGQLKRQIKELEKEIEQHQQDKAELVQAFEDMQVRRESGARRVFANFSLCFLFLFLTHSKNEQFAKEEAEEAEEAEESFEEEPVKPTKPPKPSSK